MSAPLKAGERLAPGTPPRAHSPQRDPRRVPPPHRRRRRRLFRAVTGRNRRPGPRSHVRGRWRRVFRLVPLQCRYPQRGWAARLPAAGHEPGLCRKWPADRGAGDGAAHLCALRGNPAQGEARPSSRPRIRTSGPIRASIRCAIVRAGVFDLMHMGNGRRPIGASTITQQVAKNMLLNDRMDLHAKNRGGDPRDAHAERAEQADAFSRST